ncbi:beta-ketoacyl-[acyl-carrier-protein] synthase family protein [Pajaroellobacter abortibovis]|uniref:Ketosynthase family 3 (KS3) domain-containing protein n=1 Tax=Pajaroellobacter abortibovis TaxID=1882918 RepID=A0A1L6MVT0_9BACT|nr:beta-ketoacyl-[acyl-carrier-protein] synthase family protein [Pajaroellobacter abortibovis]APR99632.1 hypothetical protein BCY86_02280 [Pajaroellobacter abortibovis]
MLNFFPHPSISPTPRALITGVGVVSSIGLGRAAFFEALKRGQSGISPIEAFDVSTLGRKYGGEVKNFHPPDHLTSAELHRMGRCSAMALAAARMAIADAHLPLKSLKGPRTAVVIGTTMGEAQILEELDHAWIAQGPHAIKKTMIPKFGSTLLPIHIARAIGAEGMALTLPAACAAGNYAIGFASDLIRSRRADIVITGAAELLQELQFTGFVRLAAMAPERCQPFDLNRQGLIVGEGAGILVIESEKHAIQRNATPQAEIGGYGLSCDAYHITRPHPKAEGSIRAMRWAIERSGITPAQVDFINAHGTGTRANDVIETKVIKEIFGTQSIPVSSIKGMLGHCMGAASALEAISCVLTLETNTYPPTLGYETPDPECDLNVVGNQAKMGKADIVLNNSLAFGGYNAVICFAKPERLPPPGEICASLQSSSSSEAIA